MSVGRLSEDGEWWWTGVEWIKAVSADRKWRWNGTAWQPIAAAAAPAAEPIPELESASPQLPSPVEVAPEAPAEPSPEIAAGPETAVPDVWPPVPVPMPVPPAAGEWQPVPVPEPARVPVAAAAAAWSPPTQGVPPPPVPPQAQRRSGGVPGWLAVVASVLCFPVGLILTWLTSWKQQTKIIATCVTAGLWFSAIGVSIATSPSPKTTSAGNVAAAPSPTPSHSSASSPSPVTPASPTPTQQAPSPSPKPPTPTPTPSGPVAHRVLTITGTGYETTQPFKIPSDEWTLSWTIKGSATYGEVTFEIYNSSGDSVDSIDAKPGSDSATIHEGKDLFYMDILVANAKYTATVTSVYEGPVDAFSVPHMTTLATYKGSGDKSTPTFHITGSVWIVVLRISSVNQYTAATAYVVQSDGTDASECSVEGDQGGSQTISYVYTGPGAYYLKVLSANTSWTIIVEQTAA